MPDRAERPVLFLEQLHQPLVHRVERDDRVAQVGGAAGCDRHRLVAAAESLGGLGESCSGRAILNAMRTAAASTNR